MNNFTRSSDDCVVIPWFCKPLDRIDKPIQFDWDICNSEYQNQNDLNLKSKSNKRNQNQRKQIDFENQTKSNAIDQIAEFEFLDSFCNCNCENNDEHWQPQPRENETLVTSVAWARAGTELVALKVVSYLVTMTTPSIVDFDFNFNIDLGFDLDLDRHGQDDYFDLNAFSFSEPKQTKVA